MKRMDDCLAVRISGKDDAPPLVLLHAITTNAAMWATQLPLLEQHFRVIAVDLPGHGRSPLLAGAPSLAAYAAAVNATLKSLEPRPAAVMGLSLGGMVAQRMALQEPDQVRALVLAATSGIATEPVKSVWYQRMAEVAEEGISSQIAPTIRRWFTPRFQKEAPLTVESIQTMIASTPAQSFIAAAQAITGLDHLDALASLRCPTLVIGGDQDTAAPPQAVATLAEAIPGATLEMLPGAHMLSIEQPVPFSEKVGAFLQEYGK